MYIPNRYRKVSTSAAAVAMFLLFGWSSALAHDFLIEPAGQNLMIVFGHGTQREEFDRTKVKSIRAVDVQGREVPVQKEKKGKGLALKTTVQPVAVVAEIDNGYWSKTIYGWKELPKRKASRVVKAIRSLFFTKTILAWNDAVQQGSSGSRIDLIPTGNPFTIAAGNSLKVNVRLDGRPLQGAEVIGNDHSRIGTTDKEGMVEVRVVKGVNVITVEHSQPLKDDPDADELVLAATLTFEVKN